MAQEILVFCKILGKNFLKTCKKGLLATFLLLVVLSFLIIRDDMIKKGNNFFQESQEVFTNLIEKKVQEE